MNPDTSYGFAVIEFARDVLEEPLDPWQQWLVVHAGELLEDGRPRFRQVLAIVARQNGKSHLLFVLALYWLYVERVALVLGMSTTLEYAKEAWLKAVDAAQMVDALAENTARARLANGQEELTTVWKSRYKIAASSRRGGRSLTVDRLVIDEIREHDKWDAWDASTKACNARPHAQIWAISNQGDDRAVVLDSLRDSAIEFIETGEGDYRLGIFEWSAEDGADPLDPETWAAANPNLGHRIDPEIIQGDAIRAVKAGGEQLAGFRTEVLCQRVRGLNPAVDPDAWQKCMQAGHLTPKRTVLCVDVSPDGLHATVVAASPVEGDKVRVKVRAAWDGQACTDELRRDLPKIVASMRPRKIGWFPSGPAAAIAADLRERPGWPPLGTEVEEIRGDLAAACMGFAEQVVSGRVVHDDDPLLNAHVGTAERLKRGDAWVFSRRGEGHCDAAYAAAGAVHLARSLPQPVRLGKVIAVG